MNAGDRDPDRHREHWIHPELTSALDALPAHIRDESMAFNDMGDHQQRLQDRDGLSVTSIDRLLFSTDYPFQHPTREDITTFLGHFASDEDRRKFSSTNAAALFGLDI